MCSSDLFPSHDNEPLKRLDKIIEIIGENRDITIYELANKLNVADKTIKRDIAKLKEQNRVIRPCCDVNRST